MLIPTNEDQMAASDAFLEFVPLLKRAFHLSRAVLDDAARAEGISVSKFGVLRLIHQTPGVTAAEVARGLAITAQSCQVLVAGLVLAGLVEGIEAEDRRVRPLKTTRAGEDLLSRSAPAIRIAETRMLARLSVRDRRHLIRLMDLLANAASAEIAAGERSA